MGGLAYYPLQGIWASPFLMFSLSMHGPRTQSPIPYQWAQ